MSYEIKIAGIKVLIVETAEMREGSFRSCFSAAADRNNILLRDKFLKAVLR